MSETEKLLPCPFCGAKHVRPHQKRAGNHTSAEYHYSIRCGVCTFNGPRGLTAEQAVEAWNRRAHLAKRDVVEVPVGVVSAAATKLDLIARIYTGDKESLLLSQALRAAQEGK